MASFAGALKTLVVATNVVEGRVYVDRADAGAVYPFVIVDDFLGDNAVLVGGGEAIGRRRIAQVTLYFSSARPTSEDSGGEDKALVRTLYNALEGARITGDDGKAFKVRVNNRLRQTDLSGAPGYIHDLRLTYLPT